MFYFIRSIILYLVLFIGFALGIQKGFQHYYAAEQGIDVADVPKSFNAVISQRFSRTRETETGLILAGISAQNRRDWGQAWKNFSRLNEKYDDNPSFALRAFTLALGNGEYDQALAIANKLKTNYFDSESEETVAESYDLVRLFLILNAIKLDQDVPEFPQFKNGALAKFCGTDYEGMDRASNVDQEF